jgi:hypothetical protein
MHLLQAKVNHANAKKPVHQNKKDSAPNDPNHIPCTINIFATATQLTKVGDNK